MVSENPLKRSDPGKCDIANLLTQLAATLNSKVSLEAENAALKLEIFNLKDKLRDVKDITNEKSNILRYQLKYLKETLESENRSLQTQNNKLLEERHTYFAQLQQLQEDSKKREESFHKIKIDMRTQLATLEGELTVMKCNYEKIKEEAKSLQRQTQDYEEKLRNSQSVISNLHASIKSIKVRPKNADKTTQTVGNESKQKIEFDDEDIMKELFFKQNYTEPPSDLPLFINDNGIIHHQKTQEIF